MSAQERFEQACRRYSEHWRLLKRPVDLESPSVRHCIYLQKEIESSAKLLLNPCADSLVQKGLQYRDAQAAWSDHPSEALFIIVLETQRVLLRAARERI